MKYIERHISVEQLLLDPNNYRFQELDEFVYADEGRFHEVQVQNRAYSRLKQTEGLRALKGSIIKNGYVRSERIVVRLYSSEPELYLVIEGNRRTAAAKWILEDHAAGAMFQPDVISSLIELPCVVVQADPAEIKLLEASLMGIRHVSGIKQWGGYQRAKLVVAMRDELNLSAGEVAERLAMSTHEVNRRYRAFKALEQYHEDDDFGEFFKPSLYPLFHEAVSLPVVTEWLSWDETICAFTDEEELNQFYACISPRSVEDPDGSEQDLPPKITNYSQVRELRSILQNEEAKEILLEDDERSFDEALAIAKQPEIARHWVRTVSAARRALQDMSIRVLKEMSPDEVNLLEKLQSMIKERLNDIRELRN
jgi:ParB-like nuclease domain